eukprot:Sdes_comp21703_c0_seq1m20279
MASKRQLLTNFFLLAVIFSTSECFEINLAEISHRLHRRDSPPSNQSSTASPPTSTETPTSDPNTPHRKADQPPCTDLDYEVIYTECDADQKRWAVFVWKEPHSCTGGVDLPGPRKNLNCQIECSPGNFLPIGEDRCQACPAGTFSLGGGEAYKDWKEWPADLSTQSVALQYSPQCTGWSLQGDHVESGDGSSDCYSFIRITANLKKPGYVAFTYLVPFSSEYHDERFGLAIRNSDCMSSPNDDSGDVIKQFPATNGTWKTHKEPLKSGANHIYLFSSNFNPAQYLPPSKIKYVEIQGTSFHDQCFECPAGTFSPQGASACTPCPRNTKSAARSSECAPCLQSEYANPRSERCVVRAPCTEADFHFEFGTCGADNRWVKTFTWREPKICAEGALSLPAPLTEECPPCNPGFHRQGGDCVACGAGMYSNDDTSAVDSSDSCRRCPSGTAAPVGLYYEYWREWPLHSFTVCYYDLHAEECSTPGGWQLHGSHMDSGRNHGPVVTLVFVVDFEVIAKSVVRINSTVVCEGKCLFYGYDDSLKSMSPLLFSYSGARNNSLDTFNLAPGSHELTLVFLKQSSPDQNHALDRVQIHGLQVDYTLDGGAKECVTCPGGLSQCGVCAGGEMFVGGSGGSLTGNDSVGAGVVVTGSGSCQKCQANEFKSAEDPFGVCKPCSVGSQSVAGSLSCSSSCTFEPEPGLLYDLNPLSVIRPVNGTNMASSYGYFLNICDKKNMTATCHTVGGGDEDSKGVSSYVCRTTLIKSAFSAKTKVSAAISFGTNLYSIQKLADSSDLADVKVYSPRDIVIRYSAPSQDAQCSEEFSFTSVVLQCDPSAADTEPTLYSETPCALVFLWRSKYACPICASGDYVRIESKCESRTKAVKTVWRHDTPLCRDGDLPPTEYVSCTWQETTFSEWKFILIGVVVFLSVLLVVSLILFKKNRTLQYKYHALLSQDDSHGAAPVVQCIGDEDEDDFFAHDYETSGGAAEGRKGYDFMGAGDRAKDGVGVTSKKSPPLRNEKIQMKSFQDL